MENFSEQIEFYKSNKKSGIVFYIVIVFLVIFLFTISILNNYVFIKVIVSGRSMLPTLIDEQVVTISKYSEPTYGDIIVIKGEKDNGDWIIKRLIAKGGDTVKIENGKVYRQKANESTFTELKEDYINGKDCTYSSASNPSTTAKTIYEVGEGQYFYLGDNRQNSSDSRGIFGTCTREQIVGVEIPSLRFLGGIDKIINIIFGIELKEGGDL